MEKEMETRGFDSGKRYIAAFVIGTAIFIAVFFASYSLSYLEFQRISNFQIEGAYKIFEDKLDYTLFNEGTCSSDYYKKISDDLGFQGKIIDDLEKKIGKTNEDVLERKKFYTLIELEHYEFLKIMNEKCGNSTRTVLFFYSNEKQDADMAEEAGKFLGTLYSRNENMIIYSFDINLDSDLIGKLKAKYKIEKSPTIVINDDTVLEGPFNLEMVEGYLNR